MSETLVEDVSEESQAYQAKEVQQFLRHPLVLEAFAATETQIIAQWKAADNPLSREMCWHKLNAFKELRAKLRAFGDRRPTLTSG